MTPEHTSAVSRDLMVTVGMLLKIAELLRADKIAAESAAELLDASAARLRQANTTVREAQQ